MKCFRPISEDSVIHPYSVLAELIEQEVSYYTDNCLINNLLAHIFLQFKDINLTYISDSVGCLFLKLKYVLYS